MLNILVTYKITNTQTLTYIPTQSFTKFVNNHNNEIGVVRGPSFFKRHIIVLINNTENDIGFMVSKHNLSPDAGRIPPRMYTNPMTRVDKTKIKFFPNFHYEQKLAFIITVIGMKPLIHNSDKLTVIVFQTNDFSKPKQHPVE